MTRDNLSPYQYNMLKIVLQKKHFTLEDAAIYKQGTFGSMARRSYLVADYNASTEEVTLNVTNLAKEAILKYENADVLRTSDLSSLSHFVTEYVKRSRARANGRSRHKASKAAEREALAGPGLG